MDLPDTDFRVEDGALAETLAATPGLDLGRNGRLVRRPANEQRVDRIRRIHFEWECADGIRYNLVASPQAANDFARTQAFHQAYPTLGIRPVALIPVPGGDVAVLEHFEGQSLESAIASGHLSIDHAKALLDRLVAQLDHLAVPVGMDVFSRELDSMREDIHAASAWSPVDLHFIDEVAIPFLQSTCDPGTLRQRWTNGDFVARNILVNPQGDCRLIDCEFAALTAISPADFHRFGEYSDVPAELHEHIRRRLPGDPRWWRIHFCLDQIRKLSRIRRADSFALHAGMFLHRIWRDIQESPSAPPASHLFHFLGDLDELQARYAELATHSRELQNQYDSLLAHSHSLQEHYDALASHRQELQAICDSLAGRLQAVEAAHNSLVQRLYRLKRPWLWFAKTPGPASRLV